MARRQKKLCWHTTFGDIGVEEPQYRRASKRLRPFARRAKVSHRGCSRSLQRGVTDFGADVAFAQVMDKLVEHYGVVLGESTIRRVTEAHARAIFETTRLDQSWPATVGCARLIAQMDGGMVPTVEPDARQQDQRKGKKLQWREAKLCLAHAKGSCTPVYGGTLAKAMGRLRAGNGFIVRRLPVWARTPKCMPWAMAQSGLPRRSKSASGHKATTCSISIMCATISARPRKP